MKKVIIPIILLLVAGWFYWFQWKPARIRSECYKIIKDNIDKPGEYTVWDADSHYRICLIENGKEPVELFDLKVR